MTKPDIETVRSLGQQYSNWGRWGDDDEKGTLNFVTPEMIAHAASLVKNGKVISMGLPYDEKGPQTGHSGRFNPIRLMTRDGADVVAQTSVRDFYGGNDRYFRSSDDLVIMPLQAGTQWDALGHVFFEEKMFNGYGAEWVSSKGALKGSITNATTSMVGRGVLLDVARAKGVDWLEPGYAISSDDLRLAEEFAGLTVGRGDYVFVRTGVMASVRSAGSWGDYAGGPAPGLGLASVDWIAQKEIAAIAGDSWGLEVKPNETSDVHQPLHLVLIVHMGLWLGEIFDLEAIGLDCAEDRVYEFMFCGPPLPFTRGVASPLNPLAIK